MEAFCNFVIFVIFIYPPTYDAIPTIQSNEIESTQYENHQNFHNGLSVLSRLLTTPSTTSTTPHTTTSESVTFGNILVRHYPCAICGMTFSTVEDVKKHYVNQHNADPIVIHAKFHNPQQYSHYINHQPNAAIGRPPFETQAAYADHIRVNVDKYISR